MSGSMGNPLKAIETAVPERIREAREERDKAVALVLALSEEIAKLEVIQLVGGEAAGPVLEPTAEAAHSPARRRSQPPEPPPAATSPDKPPKD